MDIVTQVMCDVQLRYIRLVKRELKLKMCRWVVVVHPEDVETSTIRVADPLP